MARDDRDGLARSSYETDESRLSEGANMFGFKIFHNQKGMTNYYETKSQPITLWVLVHPLYFTTFVIRHEEPYDGRLSQPVPYRRSGYGSERGKG
jgi:hypothetical protein